MMRKETNRRVQTRATIAVNVTNLVHKTAKAAAMNLHRDLPKERVWENNPSRIAVKAAGILNVPNLVSVRIGKVKGNRITMMTKANAHAETQISQAVCNRQLSQ